MRAGRRDRRVSIQRRGAPADNGYTIKPGGWVEVATRKAGITWSKGSEAFRDGGREHQLSATFEFAHDSVTSQITEEWRIVYSGRGYDVKSANEIGRREGVECFGVAGDDPPDDV